MQKTVVTFIQLQNISCHGGILLITGYKHIAEVPSFLVSLTKNIPQQPKCDYYLVSYHIRLRPPSSSVYPPAMYPVHRPRYQSACLPGRAVFRAGR